MDQVLNLDQKYSEIINDRNILKKLYAQFMDGDIKSEQTIERSIFDYVKYQIARFTDAGTWKKYTLDYPNESFKAYGFLIPYEIEFSDAERRGTNCKLNLDTNFTDVCDTDLRIKIFNKEKGLAVFDINIAVDESALSFGKTTDRVDGIFSLDHDSLDVFLATPFGQNSIGHFI